MEKKTDSPLRGDEKSDTKLTEKITFEEMPNPRENNDLEQTLDTQGPLATDEAAQPIVLEGDDLKTLKLILERLDQLHHLNKLDELKRLDRLDKINDLEKLKTLDHLSELKKIDELKGLEGLKKLEKLEDLNQLDRLEILQELKELGKLEVLQKLDNLSKLDDLSQLGELKKLDELFQLKELRQLDKLEELKELERIEKIRLNDSLERLEELTKLNQLKALNQLQHLEHLEKLSTLEKVDKLELLNDPKVKKMVETISNLPLFRDKFFVYIVKSIFNSLFEFIKVGALCGLFFYFIFKLSHNSTLTSMLPVLNWGKPLQVNFALEILKGTSSTADFNRYFRHTKDRVKADVHNFFSRKHNAPFTVNAVYELDNIMGYSYVDKNSPQEYNLKEFTNQQLYKGAQRSLADFGKTFEYEKEKNILSTEEIALINQMSIFLSTKAYAKAILLSTRFPIRRSYKSIDFAVNYAIYMLYLQDREILLNTLKDAEMSMQ